MILKVSGCVFKIAVESYFGEYGFLVVCLDLIA